MPLLWGADRPGRTHLSSSQRVSALTTLDVLRRGEITPIGRLRDASNLALVVEVRDDFEPVTAVYKPVSGERPLWDFPHGTLAGRERAAYLLSVDGGWDLVPPTVLREGPLGTGSVQEWVEADVGQGMDVVTVIPRDELTDGYIPVLEGTDEDGNEVVVAHADAPDIRSAAVFDAVINNGDRKGGHLVRRAGHLTGFDHGVSFHEEPKLRTVLWGWAGEPIAAHDLARLDRCRRGLREPAAEVSRELPELLTTQEREALVARVEELLTSRRMPLPSPSWPSIPWPVL